VATDGIRIAESMSVPRIVSTLAGILAVLVAGATIGLAFLAFVRKVYTFTRTGFEGRTAGGAILVVSVQPD